MIKRYAFTVSSDFIGPRQKENGGFVDYEEYAALQQKLDRLEKEYKHVINQHMPRTSEGCDEGWSRVIEAQELQQKLDAMAAENAALKIIVKCVNSELYGKGFEVAGWHLNGDLEPLDNWFTDNAWGLPETPVTDAYLNSVRAEGVEMFGEHIAFYHHDSKGHAVEFAKQLRSGTHDTADKAG